jgi:hypothetical protein
MESFKMKPAKWLISGMLYLIYLLVATESKANVIQASDEPMSSLPCPKLANMVFYLQRDPDANTVIYELNFKKDGTLNTDNPVKGSWIRYSEKGQRKDLTRIEKRFAYGIHSKYLSNEQYELKFVSYKKLPLYLRRDEDNQFRVFTEIKNEQVILKRIFIRINGGSFWFPKVQYIELVCTDTITGKELNYKIKI